MLDAVVPIVVTLVFTLLGSFTGGYLFLSKFKREILQQAKEQAALDLPIFKLGLKNELKDLAKDLEGRISKENYLRLLSISEINSKLKLHKENTLWMLGEAEFGEGRNKPISPITSPWSNSRIDKQS